MVLLEFINRESLGDAQVVDVLLGYLVAFLTDILLGSDDLIFVLKSVEGELAELLCKVVWRDLNHTIVGGYLFFLGWGKLELAGDQIVVFF